MLQVSRFVQAVCHFVIPDNVWGTQENTALMYHRKYNRDTAGREITDIMLVIPRYRTFCQSSPLRDLISSSDSTRLQVYCLRMALC